MIHPGCGGYLIQQSDEKIFCKKCKTYLKLVDANLSIPGTV